jgi:hypothetical protein
MWKFIEIYPFYWGTIRLWGVGSSPSVCKQIFWLLHSREISLPFVGTRILIRREHIYISVSKLIVCSNECTIFFLESTVRYAVVLVGRSTWRRVGTHAPARVSPRLLSHQWDQSLPGWERSNVCGSRLVFPAHACECSVRATSVCCEEKCSVCCKDGYRRWYSIARWGTWPRRYCEQCPRLCDHGNSDTRTGHRRSPSTETGDGKQKGKSRFTVRGKRASII